MAHCNVLSQFLAQVFNSNCVFGDSWTKSKSKTKFDLLWNTTSLAYISTQQQHKQFVYIFIDHIETYIKKKKKTRLEATCNKIKLFLTYYRCMHCWWRHNLIISHLQCLVCKLRKHYRCLRKTLVKKIPNRYLMTVLVLQPSFLFFFPCSSVFLVLQPSDI